MKIFFALAVVVSCGKTSNDRQPDRSSAATAPASIHDAAWETNIPGGLATLDEQRTALKAFQGRWRFPWTISSAPADATETVWVVSGNSFEITDGSRHRTFSLQIVAPCLARLVGENVENPFIPFLVKPDGLQLSQGGAFGFRRGDRIVLCSRAGKVFIQDGSACTAVRFGWSGDPPQPLAVTCERRRAQGLDEIVFHHGEFSDSAHFTGDDLSETPLPPPRRPSR